nr:IPT/TIG domain-containing protein [Actinomycetota bacterium]
MRRLARVARRLLPSRVLLSLLLLATAVSWAASLPQPIASAPSSYSAQGYTIFAADSGTFNFDTTYDGDCYSAGCGTSGWVAAAADLQTGGYFYANSCGTVAAFGMSVSPIYISTGCDLVAVAVPDNGTGAWAMDSSGNVYAEGGAPSYGGVGDCGCWKQIMPLPAGGYELLAANGVVNGFGPGAWNNTTAWDTSGNLVAGAYDPTTNSVYALSSAGCVYRITPGGGTQLACYSMGATPVAIAADNVSGWWALDSAGQVYAGSGAPYLGNAPSPLNAPAIAIGGYEVAPSISSLSATSFVSQNGGTITVNGSAFDYGSATVYLNGNALSTTWNSSTSLTATLPPEPPGGYTITVGDVIGSSGGDAISYSCAAPTITSITPTSLDTTTGGSVTVTGNDFFCPGSTSSASFNGTGISYTTNSSANSYSISMSLPTEVTPGSYTIQLTNPGGSASSGESYVYPPPSGVASFQVSDTSPAATTVTGSDFYGTTSLSFQYGSNAAVSEPATVNSPTSLVVTPPTPAQLGVPTSSDATVNVTVNSGGGSTTTTATYIAAPVISSLSTSSFTYSGGAVTLTGSDFVSPVNVTFANGSTTVTDTVTPTSSTSLTVTAPTASALGISSTSSATATVTVSAFGGSSSASTITYYPAPTISSLGTTSFTYAGASTTVTGTGFYSPVTVTFANGSTTVTDTVSPTSSSSLTVTTPTASALGISSTTSTPVTVTVTAFGGTSNSSTITYYPAPVISAVNTAYMPFNGGSMTLGGTGFYSPLSIVFQYGTNSPVSVTATPTSSTSVTFNSPSATALGLTGTATESVSFYVSAAGGSSASNSVDYVPNPIITGVSPNQLTFSGGTISVTGSNFVNPVSVSFQYGTNAAVTTSVAPTSSTTLSVTAPTAAALGISSTTAVSVVMTLTTFSGSSPESANYALTYYPPATVASVTPNQLAFSGSTLTITGTGFYSPVTVTFANGSTTVTDTVTPSSSTSLTVAAPAAGTLGISGTTAVPVSVTVSAFGGTSSAATITYYPTPSISSISPGQLTFSGGSLNVTGTGFYPVLSVTFTNGATVVTENVTPTSSTALTVTAPAASALGVTTTGDVSVTITTPGGTSSAYS